MSLQFVVITKFNRPHVAPGLSFVPLVLSVLVCLYFSHFVARQFRHGSFHTELSVIFWLPRCGWEAPVTFSNPGERISPGASNCNRS